MSSPPTTLGQYQIIREIARSNDIVYEAYDPLMNRRVAVKELMMPHGSTPQQMEDRISRFKREAQAAGTLNHPNIMTVYSFAEDAGRTFMAMEYLDGQTLRNELDARGALPMDKAISIACDVLSGLEHAHSKGVIHRDIKPDNIQILSTGQIKITDFGIARLTFQPNLTVDGQVFGTPSYMSPEQVVGRDIDARSDIFSVGVMLYEMIAGQKPFSGDSVVSTTYAIMNKEPDQPANVSWPLWSVISRALEKSPTMRWASAADMKEALDDALNPHKGAMPVIDPSVPAGFHPSTNPYAAAPTAPPVASIYGGQPAQAPFNPYVPPGPNANPYAAQYGQTQASAPLTFPYNPYNAGGGGYAPHTPGVTPPGAIPIYNPPPPRRPLLKPEQVVFAKRVMVAMAVVGTIFALLLVAIWALISLASRIDDRTARIEAQQAAQEKVTADKLLNANRPAEAENEYANAHQNNPGDPSIPARAAANYEQEAVADEQQLKYPEAALLYSQAAEQYNQAISVESNSQRLASEQGNFIQSAYNSARMALMQPDVASEPYRIARVELEKAIPVALSTNSNLYDQMRQLLGEFQR